LVAIVSMLPDSSFSLFFFFQAEDGIRDLYVTGVQTLLFRSGGLQRRISAEQRRGHRVRLHDPEALLQTPVEGAPEPLDQPAGGQIGRASCRESADGPVGRGP